MTLFFPDNTVLINFHIIDGWELLDQVIRGNGRWSAAVSSECAKSENAGYAGIYESAAQRLGEAIFPVGAEHLDIRMLRTQMADPADDHPLKHLGEAETLTIVSRRFQGSRFLTDDGGARVFSNAMAIPCIGTGDIFGLLERISAITRADHQSFVATLSAAQRHIRYWYKN